MTDNYFTLENEELDIFEQEEDTDNVLSIGRKIKFDRSERRIRDLYNDWQEGLLDPSPNFQRGYVWDGKKPSLLIESILLNVPIPLIYTAEDTVTGAELVIDGQQRLLSSFKFMNNEFPLKGLKIFSDLDDKLYKDLDREYQLKIQRYPLSVVKISSESDEEVKFEIFERINSGSVNLNEQEIRNCIYRGYYNEFLKECAKDPLFLELVFDGVEPKRMENVVMALRFFAFYLDGIASYPGRLKTFLNEHMKKYQKLFQTMDETERNKKFDDYKKVFKKCLELSKYVFGKEAFKTCMLKSDKSFSWNKVNMSLFDVVMAGFATYDKSQIIPKSDSIRESLINIILTDSKFLVKQGTLQKEAVRYRFNVWNHELQSVIDSPKQPRSFSYKLKQELYNNNSVCFICGQQIKCIDDCEIDHNVPYWKGGETISSNARLTHRFCNRSKSGNIINQ